MRVLIKMAPDTCISVVGAMLYRGAMFLGCRPRVRRREIARNFHARLSEAQSFRDEKRREEERERVKSENAVRAKRWIQS